MNWSVSGDHYVGVAIKNISGLLMNHGCELKASIKYPFTQGYCPDLDNSPELDQENISYCQYLIGIPSSMVELRKADVAVELSLLSIFLVYPIKTRV